ncbi:MAG: hypothetical protein DCC65_05765 [Planctomycetota bacterium]|nr:MAG: hypothetical protein DCC65_05765 [Planctomycetota bacterium]
MTRRDSSNSFEVDVITAEAPEEIDHALIVAAQRGERRALDSFVRRNDRWVRGVVYATCGNGAQLDDVVQHVWTRVWEQLGTLADPARWRGWLYALARNAAIDAGTQATRRRKRQVPLDQAAVRAAVDSEPALRLIRAEQEKRTLAAIKGLPEIYREPFVLRHLQDWSYAQIAEALGMPVDTVETRLVRARRLLRQALSDGRSGDGRNDHERHA